jgi:hypothetical protein
VIGGRDAYVFTGTMTDDKTKKIRATLVKRGAQVWRSVIVSTGNRAPTSDSAMQLQNLLFESLD